MRHRTKLLIGVLGLCAAGLWFARELDLQMDRPAASTVPVRIDIKPGEPLRSILLHLQRLGAMPHARMVEWDLRLHRQRPRVQAGTYDIDNNSDIDNSDLDSSVLRYLRPGIADRVAFNPQPAHIHYQLRRQPYHWEHGCRLCNKTFGSAQSLSQHQSAKHSCCSICGKWFRLANSLAQHSHDKHGVVVAAHN